MFFKKAKCFTILFKTLHITPRRSTSNFFTTIAALCNNITNSIVNDITKNRRRRFLRQLFTLTDLPGKARAFFNGFKRSASAGCNWLIWIHVVVSIMIDH